ncbi:MAG: hypothetical protein V1850_03985 [Candidatus Bathyarchaeota archaeon]
MMLRYLIQTTKKVNEKELQHLKDFTANFIDNRVHPKTKDIDLYIIREIADRVVNVLSEKGVISTKDSDAVEKHVKFLITSIPRMGTKELHYLISELMSGKPIIEIKPMIHF